MGDIRPGENLTIEKLLRALRERLTVMYVNLPALATPIGLLTSHQSKQADLTLDEVRHGWHPFASPGLPYP